MSSPGASEPAVRLSGVGKMYKVFRSRRGIVLDALGLARPGSYREFWALRELDLELRPGERLGLIGRNGAGKSTVLRLLTGRIHATEGTIEVSGRVNALLETSGGLHPEFSGYENVRAALQSMGYEDDRIRQATEEIAEFTELGRFLDQPFKTYSLGMQSRLAFAVATAVEPEILVVDEMLGAGDAYFFSKALERMEALISSGAAVLIVSHALDHIIRFCDEAIWLDRGRVVMRAASTDVVRAYDRFTRELEDRRLRARNRKVLAGRYDAFEREGATDQLEVAIDPSAGVCEVAELRLRRDGEVEEVLRVGDAQDADEGQTAFVELAGGGWGRSEHLGERYFRRLGAAAAPGRAVFALWFFYPGSRYELETTYRSPDGPTPLRIERAGGVEADVELPATPDWRTERIAFGGSSARRAHDGTPGEHIRWPGEGTLRIEEVTLHGEGGREQAVFAAGSPLTVRVTARAVEAGRYPITPAVSLYRADGILVSNHPGEELELDLAEGEFAAWELAFGPLNLGDGRYLLTPALYRRLTHLGDSPFYDLLDRSHTFEVAGNAPFANGVFQHPARWQAVAAESAAAPPAVAEDRA